MNRLIDWLIDYRYSTWICIFIPSISFFLQRDCGQRRSGRRGCGGQGSRPGRSGCCRGCRDRCEGHGGARCASHRGRRRQHSPCCVGCRCPRRPCGRRYRVEHGSWWVQIYYFRLFWALSFINLLSTLNPDLSQNSNFNLKNSKFWFKLEISRSFQCLFTSWWILRWNVKNLTVTIFLSIFSTKFF